MFSRAPKSLSQSKPAPPVLSLTERIALQPPDELALAAQNFRMTYGELNACAAALAKHLESLGAGPGVPVAILAYRSPDAVISALAVMRAGAPYLPLDPAYPQARLDAMLRDSGAPLLIVDRATARKAPPGPWTVIDLDEIQLRFNKPEPPPVKPAPDSPAYIIYTSGSTGHPKGVVIPHSGLLNLVEWHLRAFAVTPADRASQLAAPACDAAVWETWPYLAIGASLHFPDDFSRTGPKVLREWLISECITIAMSTAALAEDLMSLQWPRWLSLRILLTGGDRLRHYPPAGLPFVVVNNYGPTEATVVATSGILPLQPATRELPSIGRPIANVKAVIVDDKMRPVRNGEPGELCLGGPGVALGYVNLPELTAAKFVKDLSSSDPRARLYRTGDLVRQLPDGDLAFLGRLDDQIKLRGHRIEPAEIEIAINAHPGVQASAVIAHENAAGEKRLIAFVVPGGMNVPGVAELQDGLRRSLPEYMVPSEIVFDELPLLPNGKLDRATLRARAAELELAPVVVKALAAGGS
ncbi:MAG: amino acid adenylation domain-containing protein [Bryobacteraceae bacterium]